MLVYVSLHPGARLALDSAPSIALLNDIKMIRMCGLCLEKTTIIMFTESYSSPFPYLYLLAPFKN